MPAELVAACKVEQVSLYVNWNNGQQREDEITDLDSYYEYLRSAETLPTTEPPTTEDFLARYRPVIESGGDVVSIHISSALSETTVAAVDAAERLSQELGTTNRITVFDSEVACGALGLIVLAAATEASLGSDRARVIERAASTREQLRLWFYVDTLEFLRRGGRIGPARAWLGSTLRIKPILTLDSEIAPIERVRTGERARERMVDYLRSRHEDDADGWTVQHTRADEQAEEIVAEGREIFACEPLFVSEIGPVIGTHVGPGMISVAGVSKALTGQGVSGSGVLSACR